MPVSVAITWEDGDDPHGALAELAESGRLADALTALALGTYSDLAGVEQFRRADIMRSTARLADELTHYVRYMAVAAREEHMTWGTLASNLTGSPHNRGKARSTYAAGLRQLGRPERRGEVAG